MVKHFLPIHFYAVAGLALTLLAGCQKAVVSQQTDAEGLANVDHTGMAVARADPQFDFSNYRTIVIGDLGFSRLQIVQPSDNTARYSAFTLNDKDKGDLAKAYRDNVATQLSRDGAFTVATPSSAKAPGTLILFTEMVRLQPNAPREQSERFTESARDKTFTKGAGSMTLEAWLIDAGSGKTVVALGDTLVDTEIWGQNDPVANRAAVERAFSSWGLKLRDTLADLRGRQH